MRNVFEYYEDDDILSHHRAVLNYAKDSFQDVSQWVADQRNLREVFR